MTPDPPFPPCMRQSIQKTSWATSLPGRGGGRPLEAPNGAIVAPRLARIASSPLRLMRCALKVALLPPPRPPLPKPPPPPKSPSHVTAATATTATGRHRQQPHRYHCRHRPQTLPSPHPAAEPRRRHRRRPTRPQTPQTSPWASPLALQHLELDGLRVDRASAESLLSTIAY